MMRVTLRNCGVLICVVAGLTIAIFAGLTPAGAVAGGKVIGMTSSSGSHGGGITFGPGIPQGGKGVKQTVTISGDLSNITCSGFGSTFVFPAGGTESATLTSKPLSCAVLATNTEVLKGTLPLSWTGDTGSPSQTTVTNYKVTLEPGGSDGSEIGKATAGLQGPGEESGTDTV